MGIVHTTILEATDMLCTYFIEKLPLVPTCLLYIRILPHPLLEITVNTCL